MEYHPDRISKVTERVLTKARKQWDALTHSKTPNNFLFSFSIFEMQIKHKVEKDMQRVGFLFDTLSKSACLENKEVMDCTTWMQAPYWIAMNVILEDLGYASYSKLLTDSRYQHTVERECAYHKKDYTDLNTTRVMRYMLSAYQHYGKKVYTVSPGLSFTLQHTELRKMPAELLTLPYPCIYLVMPPNTFSIYNHETGTHYVEGAYIVDDYSVEPRSWKLMLTGVANENSVSAEDDALYHYNIVLENGKSLEECIAETVKLATKGLAVRGVVGDKQIVTGDLPDKELKVFNSLKGQLIDVFKYAACVCLYATHPDAETEPFNSSPEYQALYRRALKAKGEKRKKLFKRAAALKGEPRLLLGGSVTVSRENREAAIAGKQGTSQGSKHKVRTYVQSHWQHYRVRLEDGEYGRKYILKKAYWKGAKDLPVSNKVHRIK